MNNNKSESDVTCPPGMGKDVSVKGQETESITMLLCECHQLVQ